MARATKVEKTNNLDSNNEDTEKPLETVEVVEPENDLIFPKGAHVTSEELESVLTLSDFSNIKSIRPLITLLNSKGIRIRNAERVLKYEDELEQLQVELVKLQRWVQANKKRVAIIFEGRDAAGKGGTIDALSNISILVQCVWLLCQNQLKKKSDNGIFSDMFANCRIRAR